MHSGNVRFWSYLWGSGVTENPHQWQWVFFFLSGFQLRFILHKPELSWHLWQMSTGTEMQTPTSGFPGHGAGGSGCLPPGRGCRWSVRCRVRPNVSLKCPDHEVPLACLQLPECQKPRAQFGHSGAAVRCLHVPLLVPARMWHLCKMLWSESCVPSRMRFSCRHKGVQCHLRCCSMSWLASGCCSKRSEAPCRYCAISASLAEMSQMP